MESNLIQYFPVSTGRKIQQPDPEEIVGITLGKDLEKVLPNEIALLKRPKLKNTFFLKYIDNKLLQFKYASTKDEIVEEPTTVVESEDEETNPKGPFIIVVDSSGSMEGIPETVGKAIALGALRIALKDNRKLSIVNFGTANHEMTFSKDDIDMKKMINFLSLGFGGGTDINIGLSPAIERMKSKDWSNADLLLVSDFDIGGINERIISEIADLKQKNNRFHAIMIENRVPNITALEIFDNKYFFDKGKWNTNDVIRQVDLIAGKLEFTKLPKTEDDL